MSNYPTLNSLNSLISIITTPPIPTSPNFFLEGVSCGLDKEKERMGCTMAYYPFALWIERSQMASYHKKL